MNNFNLKNIQLAYTAVYDQELCESMEDLSKARYGSAGIGLADEYDLYDIILSHLLDEGYAETPEQAEVIMVNMSEGWREYIVEAEVLALKGGVPGSVKVKPALSIPGTSIGVGPNKPIPGTFTTTTPGQREKIASGSTTIDRGTYKQSRVGAGPTSAERQKYNTELIRQGKNTASRMKEF